MKKADLNIIKANVEGRLGLAHGIRADLGLVNAKEQQRLNKTFKPFTADPIVKEAVKGKTFAQWAGRIELLDGEQMPVLQIDRFGKRTVYLLPSDETGELTTLPESTFAPEQVKEWFYVANVCSADERDKLLFKAETVAAPADHWEELLATCGEADRRFLDKVLDMLAKEIAYKLPKILRKSLETAAVMMAAIDEQLHTMGGSTAPTTLYRFEARTEQTAAWLNQLVHKLTMRKDSLRWTQESETVFTLGPAEGAVDVITLPLEAEPVLLALHELDTVAQMVRVCVTSTICNCFFQGVGSFLDSMKEDDQYKGYTEGALWRLNLVGVLPTIVLGEQRAKAIIAELEMLDGFFWRSADKAE
ncbi:MAG: hypothetical protein ACLS69_08220 [Butyricicoccus sp.]